MYYLKDIKPSKRNTCVLSGVVRAISGKFLVGTVTAKRGNHGAPVHTASPPGGSVIEFRLSLAPYSLRDPSTE